MTSPAFAAPRGAPPVDRFSVSLNARAEHDTNLAGINPAEARIRGLEPEDTVYTPSLTVNVNIPVSRQTVFFRGYLGYSYHDQNTLLDSERMTFDGGVNGRISICDVTAEGSYQRGLSSFEDVVLAPTITNVLEVKHLGATATCARKTGIGLMASVSGDRAENDQTLLRPQDYEETAYTLGLTYSKPRLGTVTVYGAHKRTEYNHRVAVAGTEGYELDSFGLTYDRHLGARIDGSVSVAYTSVSNIAAPSLTTPAGDFDGVTYSANLNYRATSRLLAEAMFERDVTPSNRFGNSYDVGTRYRLKGTYELGSRISLNLGAEQREVDSQGSLAFAGNLTNSRMRVVFGGVTYRPSKLLSLGLDAAQEERRTNDRRFDYDNTRVGLTAGVSY
ncbi:MAG TPA: outer membrane beta-barrel protein [Phenylobacterium sp.]|nr:outer membrane beta-barrel protein [Phenylobacterium sp.]